MTALAQHEIHYAFMNDRACISARVSQDWAPVRHEFGVVRAQIASDAARPNHADRRAGARRLMPCVPSSSLPPAPKHMPQLPQPQHAVRVPGWVLFFGLDPLIGAKSWESYCRSGHHALFRNGVCSGDH